VRHVGLLADDVENDEASGLVTSTPDRSLDLAVIV